MPEIHSIKHKKTGTVYGIADDVAREQLSEKERRLRTEHNNDIVGLQNDIEAINSAMERLESSASEAVYAWRLENNILYLLDQEGNVTAVWEYDFDDQGREIRSYRNDVMRTEKKYNSKNNLVYEASYRTNGLLSEESIYDEHGNLLEKITYTNEGRENWHYIYTYDEKGRMATATMGIGGLKEYYYNDDDVMIEARTVDPDTGKIENTHTFVLDDQGRPVVEYLNKDGMQLKFTTWVYADDGTKEETTWKYQAFDKNADRYYIEGNEVPGTVVIYDVAGNIVSTTEYTFLDYGTTDYAVYTTDENTYDENGNVLTNVKITRNKGELSYEEQTENEYTPDGQLKKRVMFYHNYGYWSHLGETEHDLSFTQYESDFNDQGYRVHVKTWKCDDPYTYTIDEVYMNDEMFILYENAYGEKMGLE